MVHLWAGAGRYGAKRNRREKKESRYDEMIGDLGHPAHRHSDKAMWDAFPVDQNTGPNAPKIETCIFLFFIMLDISCLQNEEAKIRAENGIGR